MSNKVYTHMSNFPKGKQGMTAILAGRSSHSLYIFINGKWMHYANALSPSGKGEGGYKNRGATGNKGMFGEIELMSRPKGSNSIGTIDGNITSKRGIVGDTCITLRSYSRIISGDAKQHIISNNTVATDSSTNKVVVGNTHTMAFDAGQDHHYRHISYIAPYSMRVNGISAIWSDNIGTASGNNYLGIWTRPSGVTSTVAKTGTGTQLYTLKWIGNYDASSTALAAGESAQVSDNSLGTNAFDLNAGDWLILTNLNTTWSSTSGYIAAHVTLYCKFR